MPTFVTTSREVARKLRTAYLTGRAFSGDIAGHNFEDVKVSSVKRDPLSATGRWRIRIEEQEKGAPDLVLVEG
jgi:hypothetical protein